MARVMRWIFSSVGRLKMVPFLTSTWTTTRLAPPKMSLYFEKVLT